jgi:lipopolysaccharide export system permease protein
VIGGRLDRYVLRRFLAHYGVAMLYLVGLFVLVDVATRIDKFLEAREHLAAAGRSVAGAIAGYYAASLPLLVLQVAPFVTVMGACQALVELRRGNELYPMMEAGRSLARILAPVVAFALLLTAVLVALQDRIAPAAVDARLRIERAMEDEEGRTVSRIPHVRDGAGNVWSISRWDPESRTAEGVRVVPFTAAGRRHDLLQVPRMSHGRLPDGRSGWIPGPGATLLAAVDRPGGAGHVIPVPAGVPLPTDLAPADVELARASQDLEGLSTRRLRGLRDRNEDLQFLTVLLHKRWTFPLANLVLLLVGVPLVLRGEGSSGFFSILAALGVCASYFAVDAVACDLGGRGVLPAGPATWLAPILFGAAGITMMDAVSGRAPGR